MKKPTNIGAVIATLVASAILALVATWLISMLLLKLGISGFGHMVALMIAMPIAFAAIALLVARKLLVS
jgi:hypothetical protein